MQQTVSWCDVYWHIDTRQSVQSELRCNRVALRVIIIIIIIIIIILMLYFIFSSESGSDINTLRTGDADLRFYITTVQDG